MTITHCLRSIIVPVLAAVAALGLTACTGDTTPAPVTTSTVTTSATPTDYEAWRERSRQVEDDAARQVDLDADDVRAYLTATMGETVRITAGSPGDTQWARLDAVGQMPDVSQWADSPELAYVYMCAPGTTMTPDAADEVRTVFGDRAVNMPPAAWTAGVAVVVPASTAWDRLGDHLPCA